MKEEKPQKPPLVKAEVIDHFVSLNIGDNVYKPFFKGAIVEVDPITFRNLCRDGRLKAAPDSDAGAADAEKKKKKRRAGSPPPPVISTTNPSMAVNSPTKVWPEGDSPLPFRGPPQPSD